MTAVVLRGDARRLPLPDASVDLICTSPPYFGLRSYTDGGGHYDGQIGSEATPGEWAAALVACTAEWVRCLKPSGSIFVNLGDSYHSGKGAPGKTTTDPKNAGRNARRTIRSPLDYGLDLPPKTLLGLPWRYALACMDELGLILRRDIIWSKPNGLPESVTDRCRSSHEYLFHFTVRPRYYAAVDEIREPHMFPNHGQIGKPVHNSYERAPQGSGAERRGYQDQRQINPLGKLPGSVWEIPSQPLSVPPGLGVDHFAAFPMELPRRVILGWSPPGVCTGCGEGRRPVSDAEHVDTPGGSTAGTNRSRANGIRTSQVRKMARGSSVVAITGYACGCTPYTDHPVTGSSGEGYNRPGEGIDAGRRLSFPETPGPPSRLSTRPRVDGGREYHFEDWTPPPTRPALVVDPFGGTGTTALVASMLGRTGVSVDLSADYCRLARWRTTDPAERARALQVPKPPPVPDGQGSLFDDLEAS